MAYNISTWKTKRLENFVIPLDALYNISEDLKRRGWMPAKPKIIDMQEDTIIEIEGLGEGYLRGELAWSEKTVAVKEIEVCGEGSGRFMLDIFKPALIKSTGILEAILIWEGGDSISHLIVENGKVAENKVEL